MIDAGSHAPMLFRDVPLTLSLTRREVAGRYRGSVLGIFWSLINPLFMLAIYTTVFGGIFHSRWQVPGREAGQHSMGEFAIIIFAGLTIFQIFAEVINRAPGLVIANSNYVKKVVFPLEVLVPVALGTALFHAAVSIGVLVVFEVIFMGGVPWTALLLPLVLAPFCLMVLGLGWMLASLGTYLRDIGQLLGTVVTALMFLSPVFFQRGAMPGGLGTWLVLNPLTIPIEQTREVLLWGNLPEWRALAAYAIVAATIAVLGYLFFQKTRKGFADVL
jgi:lipopolysaccharide transport system permease protein